MQHEATLAVLMGLLLAAPMGLGASDLIPTDDALPQPHAHELVLEDEDEIETAVLEIENDDHHQTNIRINVGDDPSQTGRWLAPFDGEVPAVNLAVLPNGDLLYYSGVEARPDGDTGPADLTFMVGDFPEHAQSRVMSLEVTDGTVTTEVRTPSPEAGGPEDMFCSGTTIGADGRVISTGATEWHTLDEGLSDGQDGIERAGWTPLKGGEQTMLYSHGSNSWTQGADMAVDRWYPSALQLSDGRTLVASGIQTLVQFQTHNTLMEIYDPVTDTYERIEPTTKVAEGVEIGPPPADAPETGQTSVDETHDQAPNLPMYPRMFTVPTGPQKGEAFYTTAGDLWGPFGEHPLQALWSNMQTFDPETGTFTVHGPSTLGARQLATSVPLMVDLDGDRAARYLTSGGTLQQGFVATDTAEVADLSGQAPTAERTDPMNAPRWHHNSVLLPNGQVISIGGGLYDNVIAHGSPQVSILNAEIYDPDTGQWSLMAAMEQPRAYHSTAALLPDGRVITGGNVPLPAFHEEQRRHLNPQVDDETFEIFEPPYLHLDEDSRPAIEAAPEVGSYGQTVELTVSGLDEGLDSVTMLRPGAVTHGFDADQRGVELNATIVAETGGQATVEIELPGDGAIAPPGHYMVFVNEDVDGQAFPSEATFLQLG